MRSVPTITTLEFMVDGKSQFTLHNIIRLSADALHLPPPRVVPEFSCNRPNAIQPNLTAEPRIPVRTLERVSPYLGMFQFQSLHTSYLHIQCSPMCTACLSCCKALPYHVHLSAMFFASSSVVQCFTNLGSPPYCGTSYKSNPFGVIRIKPPPSSLQLW